MKYYIASALENYMNHNDLRDKLAALKHEITYDWTVHGPVYKEGLHRLREVAIAEVKGVLAADVVIVLWPGGRGTHFELGAAIAVGIPVIFCSPIRDHHEAAKETCAFYHHPLVRKVQKYGDILELMQ